MGVPFGRDFWPSGDSWGHMWSTLSIKWTHVMSLRFNDGFDVAGLSIRLTPMTSPVLTGLDQRITPKRMLFTEGGSGQNGVQASNGGGGGVAPSSPSAGKSSKPATPTRLADSPRALANSLEGGLDDVDLLKIGNSPVPQHTVGYI